MTEILMFNLNGKKAIEIKNICRSLNIGYREVPKSDYSLILGNILGIINDDTRGEDADFSEEMLYLIDFSDGMLNIFLKLLRSKKCSVALKAVMTETNINYTPTELYKEISAEHEAMQSGKSIH